MALAIKSVNCVCTGTELLACELELTGIELWLDELAILERLATLEELTATELDELNCAALDELATVALLDWSWLEELSCVVPVHAANKLAHNAAPARRWLSRTQVRSLCTGGQEGLLNPIFMLSPKGLVCAGAMGIQYRWPILEFPPSKSALAKRKT